MTFPCDWCDMQNCLHVAAPFGNLSRSNPDEYFPATFETILESVTCLPLRHLYRAPLKYSGCHLCDL